MKKILTSLAFMMVFVHPAFAQVSTRQPAANANSKSPPAGQSGVPGAANSPQKTGIAAQASPQQRNQTTTQPNAPAQGSSDSKGRKVCRAVGTTVYYCL